MDVSNSDCKYAFVIMRVLGGSLDFCVAWSLEKFMNMNKKFKNVI